MIDWCWISARDSIPRHAMSPRCRSSKKQCHIFFRVSLSLQVSPLHFQSTVSTSVFVSLFLCLVKHRPTGGDPGSAAGAAKELLDGHCCNKTTALSTSRVHTTKIKAIGYFLLLTPPHTRLKIPPSQAKSPFSSADSAATKSSRDPPSSWLLPKVSGCCRSELSGQDTGGHGK